MRKEWVLNFVWSRWRAVRVLLRISTTYGLVIGSVIWRAGAIDRVSLWAVWASVFKGGILIPCHIAGLWCGKQCSICKGWWNRPWFSYLCWRPGSVLGVFFWGGGGGGGAGSGRAGRNCSLGELMAYCRCRSGLNWLHGSGVFSRSSLKWRSYPAQSWLFLKKLVTICL